MKFEKYQADAIRHLELCETRYRGLGDDHFPLIIARRWARAFTGEQIDLDELGSVLRDVEKETKNYDIVFHGFCNDIRAIYREIWQDFLNRGNCEK
jgi:hypothetical protein